MTVRRRRSSRRPQRNPIDVEEMREGIEHEFEHTDDVARSAATACDHLSEMPDYYTRLRAMEGRAERGMAPNTEQRPLHTFRSQEDGTEARVWLGPSGYSVTLFDLDAEETVPTGRTFPRSMPDAETKAIAFAKSLVGQDVTPNARSRKKRARVGDHVIPSGYAWVEVGEVRTSILSSHRPWEGWVLQGYDEQPWTETSSGGRGHEPFTEKIRAESRDDALRKASAVAQSYMREHGVPTVVRVGNEIVAVFEPVQPNAKARSLGRRAAMDTTFGDTVEDPDSINGTEGQHLDKAMSRYETFHAKSPIRVAELEHDLPKDWVEIGDALAVMYRTDKWKHDGDDEDYKHLHDRGENKPYELGRGVRLYEPAAEVRRSKVGSRAAPTKNAPKRRLPVPEPRALTMLGYCLGFFVRRDDDGEIYECNPRGSYLFCSPSGDLLVVYSPDTQSDGSSGVLAVMAGGNLRVLKDGIDG